MEPRKKGPELDLMPALKLVWRIWDIQNLASSLIRPMLSRIAEATELIADRIFAGGRLFYAGAGTSGRLGNLDASEIPPTFGVPRDLVQTLMAGGLDALSRSVEGAEDDEEAGAEAVRTRMTPLDTLFGIAASGSTPYVVGALKAAKAMGISTVVFVCREGGAMEQLADLSIVIPVQERMEPIEGSTRMLSGDITKRVLNMISTSVMIRLGRVYENQMVYMPPTNRKLGQRAVRMVMNVGNVDEAEARRLLGECGNEVATACVMARRGISAVEARGLLKEPYLAFRRALGESEV